MDAEKQSKVWGQLIAKCWSDEAFKKKLLDHPEAVLKEQGLEVPVGCQVKIVEDTAKVVHLTLPWGRGHVLRFRAVDDNPGLLYTHRWHLDEEPSEQANWNQNFSILGTHADK